MAVQIPRAQVVPEAGFQLAFQWDERERLRHHFGGEQPQPHFRNRSKSAWYFSFELVVASSTQSKKAWR